jgi:hypothetical protein
MEELVDTVQMLRDEIHALKMALACTQALVFKRWQFCKDCADERGVGSGPLISDLEKTPIQYCDSCFRFVHQTNILHNDEVLGAIYKLTFPHDPCY